MADAAASRTALLSMGLTVVAADHLYTDQGVNSVEAWSDFNYAELYKLIAHVRKPGGGEDGHTVSFMTQRNLSVMLTKIRHMKAVNRPCTFADLRIASLVDYKALNKVETAYEENPTTPDAPTLNWDDPTKAVQQIDSFLSCIRGAGGIPLSSVLRKQAVPPEAANDPSTNYRTMDMEKKARALIFQHGAADPTEEDGPFTPQFLQNDSQTFDLLLPMFEASGTPWTHVKKASRLRSGRQLVFAYTKWALGENRLDHEVKQLTNKLESLSYTGPSRNWNLEKLLTSHTEIHTRLEALEEYGYKGLDPRMAVSYLTGSVTFDPLQVVKTQILANTDLSNDFEKCASLYRSMGLAIKADTPAPRQERNVSGLGTGGNLGVEDRFYSTEEFKKLSEEQMRELFRLREKRDAAKKGDSNKKYDGKLKKQSQRIANQRREIKSLKKKTKKQSRSISNLRSSAEGSDSSSSDSAGEVAARR